MNEAPVSPRPPVRRQRRKKTPWQIFRETYLPILIVLAAIAVLIALIVGGVKLAHRNKKPANPGSDTTPSSTAAPVDPTPSNELLQEAERLAQQYDYEAALAVLAQCPQDDALAAQAVASYTAEKDALVLWADPTAIPHISFQGLIADTARAFDGDENEAYYARNHLTTDEFRAVLQQLYEGGYVLVSMQDMAAPDASGKFTGGSIYLPQGKKPLIISFLPVHYDASQAGDGFARRLAVDDAGKITSEFLDASGGKQLGAFENITILEEFIGKNPGFSYRGARAILGLNGDEEPLGYNPDDPSKTEELQKVVSCLKRTGYQFACFTYDGLAYGDATLDEIRTDLKKWQDRYSGLLGQTDILIFAAGSDLSDDGVYSGDAYQLLYDAGFRYFCCMNNTDKTSTTIYDNYVHQGRRTINGTRITENADMIGDLFNASKVVSADRP